VRAFYKSAEGTYYYGDWVTFDPGDFSFFEPTVHTYPAQEVLHDRVQVKGYVVAGTEEITEQGFEYRPLGASSGEARTVRAATLATANGITTVLATGQVMSVVIEGLTPGTAYCYRAFVKTGGGTTYGEEQTFTTEADPTGIGCVEMAAPAVPAVIGYYDLNGRRLDAPGRGFNIVRYSDGTTRKLLMK